MNRGFSRGAGRAKFFRPELYERSTLDSSKEQHSQNIKLTNANEHSSDSQKTITSADKIGTKGLYDSIEWNC